MSLQTSLRRRSVPFVRKGSLARVSLAEVLKAIALSETSGVLEVSSGRIVRSMYFDRGFVVFTSSNSEADRLANCLLDAGRITEEEFEAASRLVVEGGRRIGAALVELGLLAPEDLERELGNQARQIAASLFATAAGVYRFEPRDCPVEEELRQRLSIYRIQLEGIRHMTNEPLVAEALPPPDTVVRLASMPPFSFEDVRFLPEELLVMEAARVERMVGAIVDRIPKPAGEVRRALYGLLSAGVVELVGMAEPAPHVPETTSDMDLVALSEDGGADEGVRAEVLSAFQASEQATPAELLGVGAGATEEEIRRAHAERQAEWEAKLGRLGGDETLVTMVEDFRRRLETAKETLLRSLTPAEPEASGPRETPAKTPSPAGQNKDEVKRLLKEIKLRRMVNDAEGVISFLYKVVELAPENPKYEAMLAQALATHPVLKQKAERHFRKAISRDPRNADLHYLFGRYYQSFDMRSRALAEFKIALRLNPGLSKARSALVELKGSEGGTLQGKLKQFFG